MEKKHPDKCYVAIKQGVEGFAWVIDTVWFFQADDEEHGQPCKKEELVLLQLVPNC